MTTKWEQLRAQVRSTPEGRAGYEAARTEIRKELAEQERWQSWHNPTSERCHGLNQKGRQCGRVARKYGDYCYIHYQDQGYDPAAEGWAEHTNPY